MYVCTVDETNVHCYAIDSLVRWKSNRIESLREFIHQTTQQVFVVCCLLFVVRFLLFLLCLLPYCCCCYSDTMINDGFCCYSMTRRGGEGTTLRHGRLVPPTDDEKVESGVDTATYTMMIV